MQRILITGTGRCGTTFLTQLCTLMGEDTGFVLDHGRWLRHTGQSAFEDLVEAGLEWQLPQDTQPIPHFPRVFKDPGAHLTLQAYLHRQFLELQHVLVPLRDCFDDVVQSHMRMEALRAGHPFVALAGAERAEWRQRIAARMGRLFHLLEVLELPYTTIRFPRCVLDAAYLYSKLSPVFPTWGKDAFEHEFDHLADVSKVHFRG